MQLFIGIYKGGFTPPSFAGLLTLFQLTQTQQRSRILAGLLTMYLGAAALGAVHC